MVSAAYDWPASPATAGPIGAFVDWFDLVFSLFVILLGAQLFTNGIEWVGEMLGLSDGMVGSVLAAIGTALPETTIPLVAILSGRGADANEVGIGAILGAPFMLSTLAMAVLGAAALMYRARRGGRTSARNVRPQPSVVRQDLVFFLIAYPLALAAGLWHVRALRYVLGAGLIGLYVAYVRRHLTASADPTFEAEAAGEVQPLYAIDWVRRLLRSRRPALMKPPLWASLGQTAFALVLIVGAARIFVDAISNVADRLGVPSLLFALLVAPVATELPEQFNGVLWLRRRRDTLAVGNVTGAMVFQSTFPVTIGLVFTPWRLSQAGLVSGLIAIAAALITYSSLRLRGHLDARLMLCQALLYGGYVVYLLTVVTANGSSS
jgi:cation:H+ antiporter